MTKPQLIDLPKICDPRGNLSFIESERLVPFEVKRCYWIYDVPGGMYRGGHAFREQDEFIVALSGSFDVVLNDGSGEQRYHLARSYYGIYVPRMTWRAIDNFSTNSVALVLSSTLYDSNDYIEDFNEFLRQKKCTMHDARCTSSDFRPSILDSRFTMVKNDFHKTSHINQCKLIELGKHHHPNGNLTAVENGYIIPFDLQRVFYIYDVPGGEARGGHSHNELFQLIVAASGAFEVLVDDGVNQHNYALNRPYQGLLVPPGIWSKEHDFSSGSICMVLASDHYDETDYVRDYKVFKQLTSSKK